jgi:hypothetical protein
MLSRRTILHNFRNPYLLRLQYTLTFLLAVAIGLIYWKVSNTQDGVQNRAGALFFMIALLTFGSMSSIDICKYCVSERMLLSLHFIKELKNGLTFDESHKKSN